VRDVIEHFRERGAAERWRTGHQLVQHDAERVQIARCARAFAANDLRSEISRRSDQQPGRPRRGLAEAGGDPEVRDLDPSVAGEQHVLGLDVTMNHAAAVRMGERVGNRAADRQCLGHAHGSSSQSLAQRLPLDVLHGQEDLAVELADVVEHDDVGMVER